MSDELLPPELSVKQVQKELAELRASLDPTSSHYVYWCCVVVPQDPEHQKRATALSEALMGKVRDAHPAALHVQIAQHVPENWIVADFDEGHCQFKWRDTVKRIPLAALENYWVTTGHKIPY